MNQEVILPNSGRKIWLKREDLLHDQYGGNKLRKLRYNLLKAMRDGHDTILTFGGAWSNHIHATAAVCKDLGFKSIGIIRGEEPQDYSETLQFAKDCGMSFHFVSRAEYKEKTQPFFIAWLHDEHGRFYLVPEGGSNYLGVQGCSEILADNDKVDFDIVASACGTGATLAGVVLSLGKSQMALGFSALKDGGFLSEEVARYLTLALGNHEMALELDSRFQMITEYHFGGYAKTNPELIAYLQEFHKANAIQLDPVYTGKMIYGLDNMVLSDQLEKGSSILAIHTGGLQGIPGIEKRIGELIYD
jgi:1-aminocyclopropane-1-carboxylate deaminase/D-cysteine desulfhydrase-like pyridoxal-dependent ACC family enzyme